MKHPRRPFVRYLLGTIVLWAILLTAWGIRVWLIPREPELGRIGFFMIFAALGSMLYFIATLGVYLLASMASGSRLPESAHMPFSPPSGIAFHTTEEVEASELCALLRDVVAFLDTLQPRSPKLRRYDDWWQHDGLHFERGTIEFRDLVAMIETPSAMLQATPDDAEVFVGIAQEGAGWYLRFRAERDADDERITGRMALLLPDDSARTFSRETAASPRGALAEASTKTYFTRIMPADARMP